MATVSDVITASLQRLNLYQAGEAPSAEDLAVGFARFNDLIESLSLEGLTAYTVTRTTWTIVPGTQNYTVGIGGTVNTARPGTSTDLLVKFQDTSMSPPLELSLGPLLTDSQWAGIPQKAMTAPYPVAAYYNPTFTNSFGTISFYMVPTSATLQGVLYAPAPVTKFALTSDAVLLPPGYLRFYRDTLAIELAPDYPDVAKVSDDLKHSAIESKANVKRANEHLQDLPVEAAGLFGSCGSSNIYSDT